MRFLRSSLAALSFVASTLTAAAASSDTLVADVTKANDIVQLATLHHDRKTMDAMLAPDFVLVLTRGAVVDRNGWLDDVADTSTKMEINQVENLTIHHYNDDCALAIGVLHIRARDKHKLTDVRMRFIDVWVKQRGRWKWASSQVAHFPQT
jgi:ketosteroid isomerase-like protein